jgi:hypothetical protein
VGGEREIIRNTGSLVVHIHMRTAYVTLSVSVHPLDSVGGNGEGRGRFFFDCWINKHESNVDWRSKVALLLLRNGGARAVKTVLRRRYCVVRNTGTLVVHTHTHMREKGTVGLWLPLV